jgi:hypothetical protein
MKNKYWMQSLVGLLFLLIVGCIKVTPTPTPDEISNLLIIKYHEGPEIQLNGHIQAVIRNTTNYCIVFPVDLGIKLFVNQDGKLSEINNYTKYIGNQNQYLNPAGEKNDLISVSLDPDTSGLLITDSMMFYAEITGHLCDDESVIIKKKIPFIIVP